MVTGIERWKEYFSEYKDKYVLIGGAACNLLEEELDMNPEAYIELTDGKGEIPEGVDDDD